MVSERADDQKPGADAGSSTAATVQRALERAGEQPTSAGDSPIIVVDDVHISFGGSPVLRGVSFVVKPRQTVCILGGSGGGKSTLLKAMIGVLKPDRGHVLIDGEHICCASPSEVERIRRGFGVTFQGSALLNSMTVAENVALPIEHHTRLPDEMIDTIVKIKLHQVDLLHAADKLPSQISGGMKKRAAVARALAMDPRILFYDEPSAGLDPIATTRLDRLIIRLKETMGITNVVVTHVLESVRRIADHVVMLDQGEVILDGSLDDLERCEDARVRQFREGQVDGPNAGVTSDEQFLQDLLM